MQILDDYQIKQKITRMAFEILENNLNEEEVFLAGINNNGQRLAQLIHNELKQLTKQNFVMLNIKVNPASPLNFPIECSIDQNILKDKPIIVIDDVANTGRTTFFAFKAIMEIIPQKIEVAVLVDRKHKSFPVKVDYVGMTLATTLQENIKAQLKEHSPMSVELN